MNKGLTRWLLLNCTNKQSPFVKTHFLTICLRLHHIQPLSALLFLIIVSLVPSSLPHSFPLLASCSLAGVLVLPKWPDPSQANSWKDASLLFPQFSSHFNPFYSSSTFSSNHPSHLVSTFFCFSDWWDFNDIFSKCWSRDKKQAITFGDAGWRRAALSQRFSSY